MPDLNPIIDTTASAVDAIRDLALASELIIAERDGVIVTVTRDDQHIQVTDLSEYGAYPRRRTACPTVVDSGSFIALLGRELVDETSVLYVDASGITAIIDDDSWRQHRIRLAFQLTPGWTRWMAADRKMLGQEDFAELVEDGIGEIAEPAGADLLELAQSIKATTSAAFRSDRRLQNGRVQFSYVEEIDAKAGRDGTMEIPAKITLVLAPVEGSDRQRIDARLRYRLTQQKLTLGVILNNPADVLRAAISDEVAKIRTEHPGALIVWGRP
jgi:hypothetical protein